jgi:ATP-dependent RNA helicase DDX19/DBP5
MTPEERDEYVEKFRKGEISVVITTNLLSRGIDVPEIQLVINFDVPTARVKDKQVPDQENYLHRIGRAGRFGVKGIALSIYDREEDERYLREIMAHYKMEEKLKKLHGPEELQRLIETIDEEANV